MLGPLGIGSLLNPMPSVFPRKSWHGQCECISHVIQQEATHGMISQNFKSVQTATHKRAAKARQRAIDEKRREAAIALGPGLLSRSPVQNEVHDSRPSACDVAAQFAEEGEQRCNDVMDFLLLPDSLQNMIRLRLVLEGFRELKTQILERSGCRPPTHPPGS